MILGRGGGLGMNGWMNDVDGLGVSVSRYLFTYSQTNVWENLIKKEV